MQFKNAENFILSKLRTELPHHLFYHGIDHVMDVYGEAERIATEKGISGYEQKLLLTAALFHDSGFIKTREGHEAESCLIAREYLPAYGYQPIELELICDMIRATQIPQSPQTYLEEILCDADLDYLGRDDFFTLSNRLYKELCFEGLIKDEREWDRQQAEFMQSHSYHTSNSVKLRQPKKEEYIKLVKSKI
jgi:hypothetical protein